MKKTLALLSLLLPALLSVRADSWADSANRNAALDTSGATVSLADEADLAQFAYLVNAGSDFAGKLVRVASMTNLYLQGHDWVPAGTAAAPFRGFFDGGWRALEGVAVPAGGSGDAGLFGVVGSGGVVSNVFATGGSVTGGANAGLLVGRLAGGTVANCAAGGTLSGAAVAGGAVGRQSGGFVRGVSFSGTIAGAETAGGVVGVLEGGGTVSASGGNAAGYGGIAASVAAGGVAGSVTAGRVTGGRSRARVTAPTAGGIAGVVAGADSLIFNSFCDGTVTGASKAGGVVGDLLGGKLVNAASRADVSGGAAGGVAGAVAAGALVANAYNAGPVAGAVAGGIAASSSGAVSNVFWRSTAAAPVAAIAGQGAAPPDSSPFPAPPGLLAARVRGRPLLASALNSYVYAANDSGLAPADVPLKGWDWADLDKGYPDLTDLTFKGSWADAENRDTGFTVFNGCVIDTPQKLAQFAYIVNTPGNWFDFISVNLSADIDLRGHRWVPIGTNTFVNPSDVYSANPNVEFCGIFNGNNHMVSGYFVECSDTSKTPLAGLFGGLAGPAQIYNIILTGFDVYNAGTAGAGGLVGFIFGMNSVSCIRNVVTYGIVCGAANVGGLAGRVRGRNGIINGPSLYENVTGGFVFGGNDTGGVVGWQDWETIIRNNYNIADVVSTGIRAGGIVGHSISSYERTYDCVNYGSVKGTTHVGGIAGNFEAATGSSFYGHVNEGDVQGSGAYVGGVAGYLNAAYADCTVANLVNFGNVRGGGSDVGGVVGMQTASQASVLTGAGNYGNVYGAGNNVGGLIGTANRPVDISYNLGDVEGGGNNVGGLIGYSYGANATLAKTSMNLGPVVGHGQNIGGVIGLWTPGAGSTIAMRELYNVGRVEGRFNGQAQVGGVIGWANVQANSINTVADCYNEGRVVAENGAIVGGIVGRAFNIIDATNGWCIITNCFNAAGVEGTRWVGGILGEAEFGTVVTGCANDEAGAVRATVAQVGGIAGHICDPRSIVRDCSNRGPVAGFNGVAGIVGSMGTTGAAADADIPSLGQLFRPATVSNCFNYGAVRCDSEGAGGILGWHYAGRVLDCANAAPVSAGDSAGGITGFVALDEWYNFRAPGVAAQTFYHETDSENHTGYTNTYYSFAYSQEDINQALANMGVRLTDGCRNTGAVSAGGSNAGGIAGRILGSFAEIRNCFNGAPVAAGNAAAGGVLGAVQGGAYVAVRNNYNWGSVTSAVNANAGIVGCDTLAAANMVLAGATGVTIENNYHAKGTVSGSAWSAAVVSALGWNSADNDEAFLGMVVSNNFWEAAPGQTYNRAYFMAQVVPGNVYAANAGRTLADLGTAGLAALNAWAAAQSGSGLYKPWTLDADGYPVFGYDGPQEWGPGVPLAPPDPPLRREVPVFLSDYTVTRSGVMNFYVDTTGLDMASVKGWMLYSKVNLPDAKWDALQFYPKSESVFSLDPLALWKNGEPYRFFKVKAVTE